MRKQREKDSDNHIYMDPDYKEASSETAYHDSTNEMNFLRDCLIKELWARMGKVPNCSDD